MTRNAVISYSIQCDMCGADVGDIAEATQVFPYLNGRYSVDVCETHNSELAALQGQMKVFIDAAKKRAKSEKLRKPRARKA